ASLLAFLAIFAIWANRQLLNTDNWAETSSQLLENDDIRTQVSVFVVDELYANVDVTSDLEQIFEQVLEPERAAVLAGPAAGGLRSLAENGVNRLLQRPRAQQLWEQANRRAQARLLQIVEGGGDVVSTSGGEVTLDLKSLLGQTQSNLGVGGRVEQKVPDDASQIVILQSDQLELAQDAVRLLKTLAVVFVVLSLALFALAIYLAEGWRREALRATGVGLLFAGAGALVARALAGDAVVDALATTDAVQPAVEATWSIGTSLMVQAATATVIYGVVILFATWFAGPTRWARASRRDLAPYLREPRWAWGVFGVVVLGLLAWAPTPAFREVIPALVLIGLLALGLEGLRRQTAREYPDARREDSFRRVRGWVRGLGARIRGREDDSRLEQLERLGRLRDNGVLDSAEYEQEKGRLLAERPAV
ncbi:MAG TPA: SHOCT domain-containing protein, partial [Thermoleophilaceae bacterium]|nr:SHOCT domain-containing protein [Thermoleophilaceae bacterium]